MYMYMYINLLHSPYQVLDMECQPPNHAYCIYNILMIHVHVYFYFQKGKRNWIVHVHVYTCTCTCVRTYVS